MCGELRLARERSGSGRLWTIFALKSSFATKFSFENEGGLEYSFCKGERMKIIVELTFLVSFSCSLFVLSLVAKVTKDKLWFSWLGGIFASVISIIYPLFHIEKLMLALLFVATTACVNLICFEYKSLKRFLEREALIAFFTFLFGGACLAVQTFLGSISLYAVTGVSLVVFLSVKTVLRLRQRQAIIDKFTYSVTLKNKGEEFRLEGFLDSGNMLYDTITKKPIMLVDFDVFHKLYGDIPYFKVLTKTFDENLVKNGHYIKVNSLSAGARMFVFSVDEAKIGEDRLVVEPMLGLSLSGFEKSFGRGVLLHSELV